MYQKLMSPEDKVMNKRERCGWPLVLWEFTVLQDVLEKELQCGDYRPVSHTIILWLLKWMLLALNASCCGWIPAIIYWLLPKSRLPFSVLFFLSPRLTVLKVLIILIRKKIINQFATEDPVAKGKASLVQVPYWSCVPEKLYRYINSPFPCTFAPCLIPSPNG